MRKIQLFFLTIFFAVSCMEKPTAIDIDRVNMRPTAYFTVSPSSGTKNTIFNFDASGCSDYETPASALEVRWDWENDGTWDTEYSITKTATHQYFIQGSYTIKMEIKDAGGLTNIYIKQGAVSITNNEPHASLYFYRLSSDKELKTFQFDASFSYDDEDSLSELRFSWDWENDGTWDIENSSNFNPVHKYSSIGDYTVNLKVTDTGGSSDVRTKTINVPETGTVTDLDNNTYQTVKIDNQWWMAENLKVTHYRNGDAIPYIPDSTEWGGLNSGAYCVNDNNSDNIAVYGRLYNWYAVNDSRQLAPLGWHVPTDDEWQTLVDFLGGRWFAGGKMKEAGTTHWESQSQNRDVTNESGFSALPGGSRYTTYPYNDFWRYSGIGAYAYFWSATEASSAYAYYRFIGSEESISRDYSHKRLGLSIRCVRD